MARKLNPDLKQSGVTCVQPESESSVKSKSDEMNVGLPTKNVDKKSMPVPVQVPMKGTKPVNTVSPVVSSPSPTKPSNFSAGTQPQSSPVSVRSEPNQPKNDTGTVKLPPLFDDDKINQKIKPKEGIFCFLVPLSTCSETPLNRPSLGPGHFIGFEGMPV